jgi:catechol 2,3-dioxygenase-like lactoylglutathione lyase family enzyme
MTIKRLDHVGVIVDDLTHATDLLTNTLGLEPGSRIQRDGLEAVFFSCGNATIEVIEISDHVERQTRLGDAPARIEHIAFEVDDLRKALDALDKLGVQLKGSQMLAGARRTAFTDAASTDGIIFQFVEHERP